MSDELKSCPWCKLSANEQEWTTFNGPRECVEVQCDGCGRSVKGFDAIAAWNALPRPAQPAPSAPYHAIHIAILDVIAATQAYLPPDGVDAQECINRVLGAIDNASIVSALNELERNPYKLAAPSDHTADVSKKVSEKERRLENALSEIADGSGSNWAVRIARAALAGTTEDAS